MKTSIKIFLIVFGTLMLIGIAFSIRSVSFFHNKIMEVREHLDAFDNMQLTEKSMQLIKADGTLHDISFSTKDTIHLYFWNARCVECLEELKLINFENNSNFYPILLESGDKKTLSNKDLMKEGVDNSILKNTFKLKNRELPFLPNNLKYFPAEFKIVNDSIWRL